MKRQKAVEVVTLLERIEDLEVQIDVVKGLKNESFTSQDVDDLVGVIEEKLKNKEKELDKM